MKTWKVDGGSDRIGQDRTENRGHGQDILSGQDRTGQDRTGHDRTGSHTGRQTEQDRTGQNKTWDKTEDRGQRKGLDRGQENGGWTGHFRTYSLKVYLLRYTGSF